MIKILIIDIENHSLGVIAQAYMKSYCQALQVISATLEPPCLISPQLSKVINSKKLNEIPSRLISNYLNEKWDYLITIGNQSNFKLPIFTFTPENNFHLDFILPQYDFTTLENAEQICQKINLLLFKFFRDTIKDRIETRCPCGANDFCRCE